MVGLVTLVRADQGMFLDVLDTILETDPESMI